MQLTDTRSACGRMSRLSKVVEGQVNHIAWATLLLHKRDIAVELNKRAGWCNIA